MTVRSAWHLPNGQTREDTRLAVGLAMASTGPLLARAGCVIGGLRLSGTAATSMQARLSPGQVWVPGTSTATQGGYPVTVDADTLLTFVDGDAALPRVDAVVVRVHDTDYDGSGRYEATLEVLAGAPAAPPAPPAVPENAELLYEVTVPAGASAANGIIWASAITDRRRYTAALGGIVPAGGARDDGAHVGQYRDVNGRLERWDGAAWRQYIPDAVLRYSFNYGYTTSTTFVETLTGGPDTPLTARFVAPARGWVHVTVGALTAVEGSNVATMSFRVRQESTGTEILPPVQERSAQFSGNGRASICTMYPVGGLTPGVVYTATAVHQSSAAGVKAEFDNRFVRVDPVA
ncbi:hypothetical protein AQ490_18470 [Wenjunlia vitaminophila]|uniref:Uncharacterized protein n=1 Tax=Wenjunlia vitaminophila TaxID=76728 RepID=A0A0T6LUL0_WENVI|nr:hypothetical protein [Wenjunlia vitaminophila]KRV49696.1 hypothetical protein AQ490_18470 [Wenjunlia vitaminophila]